jgi:hypothetical protein
MKNEIIDVRVLDRRNQLSAGGDRGRCASGWLEHLVGVGTIRVGK